MSLRAWGRATTAIDVSDGRTIGPPDRRWSCVVVRLLWGGVPVNEPAGVEVSEGSNQLVHDERLLGRLDHQP